MASKDTGHPVRLTGAQRRVRFLDGAVEIITEGGLDAVTMEAVATRVGVNKALPHCYFDNRESLIVAVFERESQRFEERLVAALIGLEGFRDRVAATVGSISTWSSSRRSS